MQTERVLSFVFERGGQLALMCGTTEGRAVLHGNSFFVSARFGISRAAQIYDLGHWPLPCPIPGHNRILRSVCVNGGNISDYNHLRK